MRSNFVCISNGTPYNRGCEAILRGSVEILNAAFGAPDIHAIHSRPPYRYEVEYPNLHCHYFDVYTPWTRYWFLRRVHNRLGLQWVYPIGKLIAPSDAVLAMGGDNYSMDYNGLAIHLGRMEYAFKKGAKRFVIWGASVGPFDKRGPDHERQVIERLSRVTAIFARESATVDYLTAQGLGSKVRRVMDPAFAMAPVEPDEQKMALLCGQDLREAIGFNFSPLMARFVAGGDMNACEQRCAEIIEALRSAFDRPIILIPHVFWPGNHDEHFLHRALARLSGGGAPVLLLDESLTAPEIKWLIARMKCFLGARTHSTLAAISSGTPTISFSYSLKSIGLNRDIYGSEDYLITAQDTRAEVVTERLGQLLDNEQAIREELTERGREWKKLAFAAGPYLKEICLT